MNKRIRMITEGAMMVAMIGAFLLIDRQLAHVLEAFLFWAFPLPILLFTVKYGLRDGIICGICAILVSFIFATTDSVFLVICSVGMGIVYGYGVYKQKRNLSLLIQTFIISLFYYVVTTYLFASFFGYDMIEEGKAMYEMMQPIFQNQPLTTNVDRFVEVIFFIVLILTPLLQTILVHLCAVVLLKRLHLAEIKMKSLAEVSMPKRISWCLIVLYGLLEMVLRFVDISSYPEMVESGLLIVQLAIVITFIFFGIVVAMVVGAIMKKKWISLVAIIGCFVFPQLVILVGMIDTATDYREKILRRYYHAR